MIIDVEDCHELNFALSSGQARWDISVTQYQCGDETGGPPGCLQYFQGITSGSVASFNFRTDSMTVSDSSTHLSGQMYSMCFRRETGFCRICYSPRISRGIPESYGLGVTNNMVLFQTTRAESDEFCTMDYLEIPHGVANTVTDSTATGIYRICGRIF